MEDLRQNAGPAERLLGYRTSIGLSVAKLAKQLRTSASHLSEIERGKRRPGLPVAVRIRDLVGIGVDDWLQGEDHAA